MDPQETGQSADGQASAGQKHRILFYAEVALPLILLTALVWWAFYRYGEKEVAKEEVKKEETAQFQEKVEKLRDVEEQIEITKKQLEELSALSSEERAKREKEREVLSATKVVKDVSVKGVEVEIKNGKKVIINRVEGYRIEVPQTLVLARSISSDWIELHDQKAMCLDPDCDPVMRIRAAEDNPTKLSIAEWLAKEEKNAGAEIYSPREKFTIQNETVYRVTEEIPGRFEGYYYYWARGTKIYDTRISRADDEIYHSALETFFFLQAP